MPHDTLAVDLADLDNFMDGETPWRMFEALRRAEPVHWNPETDGGRGFWSLTRHADVVAADRDSATFTSERFVNLEEVDDRQAALRRSMLETDGPRHLALRRLLQREFTPRAVAGYATFLRGLTAATLDAALAGSAFDFVAEIAADFPINVLARMLDVPDGDTRRLIDWGNRIIANTDPDHADVLLHGPESELYRDLPFRSPAALEVFEYGRDLAARRRGGEGTDLVSRLVNQVPADGEPLTARDFDNYFLLLVVAGNETTRHAITHSMRALIDHPDQAERLRAGPGLMPAAVEEFLRWASPVYHFRRTATRDTELGGKAIREGDKVVLWFASANRDEAVFTDPQRFDITRTPNDHITFGKGGPHFCLGAALARLEMRIMFEELLPRLADIRPAGEIRRIRSNFVNGIKQMPVTITLA
ncbi:cytochrome P450 [Actinomadura luteofluorescens]|uniref:Cytochrome P450 n=1 Tax=Actinomadura luteofluorescens TaxID=46163 RepID=A0A7Y9EMF6_9ACTN|nr:cytochrome P450 [Actinomadura luteofluorescens]NYD50384.1 cytochrome P450 [Actinomadura luteofluorescens]